MVAILEGVSLNREEISGLQLLPPWGLRTNTLNYGLGLLSCYFICDLLSIISGGYFYMFDPRGVALSVASSHAPAAKMFSLIGNFVLSCLFFFSLCMLMLDLVKSLLSENRIHLIYVSTTIWLFIIEVE